MRWLLCGSSPTPVARRVIPAVGVSLVLALFGTAFLVLAPEIPGPGWVRGAYVMFVVVVLKLPLIAILWWMIARNREWPHAKPTWLPPEQAERACAAALEGDDAAAIGDMLEEWLG